MADTRPLIITLTIYWEKSDSQYCQCGYHGGYDYNATPNGASFNGGYTTPDFDMTLDDVKNRILTHQGDWEEYKNRKKIWKVTITKDERNPTLEIPSGLRQ